VSTEAPTVRTEVNDRAGGPKSRVVREAPTRNALVSTEASAAYPDVEHEPVLRIGDIQGNIVGGFNKDFQTLIFLRIDDAAAFRPWLGRFADVVATADEVIAFNRLFKSTRRRRRYSGSVRATWINIAFTHAGLAKLTGEADQFTDTSFRSGMVAQSAALGDPTDADAEGNPRRWLVHDGQDGADVLIIVASDTIADLEAEVAQVEQSIFAPRREGRPVRSGVSIVFKEEGRTQPGALAGHEHFGFLDGVSQPGLRGRLSQAHHDVLTPRQNPDEPKDQGKPGQDLLWPGEFVFGYPGQDADKEVHEEGHDSLFDDDENPVAPAWAKDGAYLVFRRLRQDVFKFHSFLSDQAKPFGLTPAALGAKLVGRWASGAPIMREPKYDNPRLADDECANNHFEFETATVPTESASEDGQCEDMTYWQSPGDRSGDLCPFAGHIRKAYPRDDSPPGEAETQTHRLLRRGIAFGPSSRSTPEVPVKDDVDRGLLFMAYMTSITGQFEYVTEHFVNDPDFREANAGVDAILGQVQREDGGRERTFNVRIGGADHPLTAPDDWVIPTGGGYYFAPSMSALKNVLAKQNGA
jgi:Dyp-type peroxidase family